MKEFFAILVIGLSLTSAAKADVWRWVDASGNTHFVDTMKAIYTWVDEYGKVHFSNTPDHEDAVSVELVWHSSGTLADVGQKDDDSKSDGYAYPGETAEERAEREAAEKYYCKRATEVYESFINAPQLYRTDDKGEREYLSEKEAAQMIAETRAKRDALCK